MKSPKEEKFITKNYKKKYKRLTRTSGNLTRAEITAKQEARANQIKETILSKNKNPKFFLQNVIINKVYNNRLTDTIQSLHSHHSH